MNDKIMTPVDIEQKINRISSSFLDEEDKSLFVSVLKGIKEAYPNGISVREFKDQIKVKIIERVVWINRNQTGLFPETHLYGSFMGLFK